MTAGVVILYTYKKNKTTGLTGLEPATSAVTGRCSNQLNYSPLSRSLEVLLHKI